MELVPSSRSEKDGSRTRGLSQVTTIERGAELFMTNLNYRKADVAPVRS